MAVTITTLTTEITKLKEINKETEDTMRDTSNEIKKTVEKILEAYNITLEKIYDGAKLLGEFKALEAMNRMMTNQSVDEFEGYMAREVYAPLMPAEIKELLGIKGEEG